MSMKSLDQDLHLQFVRTVSVPLPEYLVPTWFCAVVFDEKRIVDGPTANVRLNTLLSLPSRPVLFNGNGKVLNRLMRFSFQRPIFFFFCYFFQSLLRVFKNDDFYTYTSTSLRTCRSLSLA